MKLLLDKQLLFNVTIQSTKYSKTESFKLYLDHKKRENIADVFCPRCKNKKCVYLSIKKIPVSTSVKKVKANCHSLNIPFKDQKSAQTLIAGDSTSCSAKKTSLD